MALRKETINMPGINYRGVVESIYNQHLENGKCRSVIGIRLDSGDMASVELSSIKGIPEEYRNRNVEYTEVRIVEEGEGLIRKVTQIQELRLTQSNTGKRE